MCFNVNSLWTLSYETSIWKACFMWLGNAFKLFLLQWFVHVYKELVARPEVIRTSSLSQVSFFSFKKMLVSSILQWNASDERWFVFSRSSALVSLTVVGSPTCSLAGWWNHLERQVLMVGYELLLGCRNAPLQFGLLCILAWSWDVWADSWELFPGVCWRSG